MNKPHIAAMLLAVCAVMAAAASPGPAPPGPPGGAPAAALRAAGGASTAAGAQRGSSQQPADLVILRCMGLLWRPALCCSTMRHWACTADCRGAHACGAAMHRLTSAHAQGHPHATRCICDPAPIHAQNPCTCTVARSACCDQMASQTALRLAPGQRAPTTPPTARPAARRRALPSRPGRCLCAWAAARRLASRMRLAVLPEGVENLRKPTCSAACAGRGQPWTAPRGSPSACRSRHSWAPLRMPPAQLHQRRSLEMAAFPQPAGLRAEGRRSHPMQRQARRWLPSCCA